MFFCTLTCSHIFSHHYQHTGPAPTEAPQPREEDAQQQQRRGGGQTGQVDAGGRQYQTGGCCEFVCVLVGVCLVCVCVCVWCMFVCWCVVTEEHWCTGSTAIAQSGLTFSICLFSPCSLHRCCTTRSVEKGSGTRKSCTSTPQGCDNHRLLCYGSVGS